MSDYIDREDAIKAFDPKHRRDWYTPWIVETLEDLPPADVAPVRHGRWEEKQPIEYYHMMECIAVRYNYACSECGFIEPRRYNYCPNCGARMDGEEDEID